MSSGWITASGQGRQSLDSGNVHQIADLQAVIVSSTNPRIRRTGTGLGTVTQFGGSYGLSITGDDGSGGTGDVVVFHKPVTYDNEDDARLATGLYYAQDIFWLLPTGISLKLQVYW